MSEKPYEEGGSPTSSKRYSRCAQGPAAASLAWITHGRGMSTTVPTRS